MTNLFNLLKLIGLLCIQFYVFVSQVEKSWGKYFFFQKLLWPIIGHPMSWAKKVDINFSKLIFSMLRNIIILILKIHFPLHQSKNLKLIRHRMSFFGPKYLLKKVFGPRPPQFSRVSTPQLRFTP